MKNNIPKLTKEQKQEQVLQNFVKKNKKQITPKLSKKEMDKRYANWQLFYLNNLDIFNEDILQIPFKEFQNLLLLQSMDYDQLDIVCSRGLGKSLVVSSIAVSLALLLPNVNVLVVSATVHQANLIIKEKIDELLSSPKSTKLNSPLLQQLRRDEWMKIVKNKDTGGLVVEFGNNSKIYSVACSDSARGNRSNIVIGDEAVLLSSTIMNRIIFPTQEPYYFKGFKLESKEILLTSASTRDSWVWKRIVDNVNNHYKSGTKEPTSGFFAGDILTSIQNGIHTMQRYESIKKRTDDFSLLTEYLNIWLGESADSIFKYEDFHKAQINQIPYYPSYLEYDFCENKGYTELDDNWVKIVATDIAVVGGKKNDQTAIILGRLNLKTNERVIEYIYTANGLNSNKQVEIMKRLFYDYGANYMVIDTKGVGNVIYDMLTVPTLETEYLVNCDKMKDGSYPSWGTNTEKSLQISSNTVIEDKLKRIADNEYEDIIIPFTGTTELNSIAHYSVWNALRNKNISLLKGKSEMQNITNDKDELFFTRNSNELAEYYLPFVQTDILINETIALNVNRNANGQLKVKESDYKDTKDVYMAFAMWNVLADKLYNRYITQEYEEEEYDEFDINELYNF